MGLDGYSSKTVEQTGTDTDCSGGKAVYYGWYEMYPKPSNSFGSTISPGDTISASVTFSGSSSYTLKLSDVTKGWTSTMTKRLPGAARSSAEVIIEAPCCTSGGGILPLADFGTVQMSNSVANGSAIGTFSPVEITMVNNSGQDKDTVSTLSNNENFSATWVRASQPAPRTRLQDPAAGPGCRTRLQDPAAGPGCRTRLRPRATARHLRQCRAVRLRPRLMIP